MIKFRIRQPYSLTKVEPKAILDFEIEEIGTREKAEEGLKFEYQWLSSFLPKGDADWEKGTHHSGPTGSLKWEKYLATASGLHKIQCTATEKNYGFITHTVEYVFEVSPDNELRFPDFSTDLESPEMVWQTTLQIQGLLERIGEAAGKADASDRKVFFGGKEFPVSPLGMRAEDLGELFGGLYGQPSIPISVEYTPIDFGMLLCIRLTLYITESVWTLVDWTCPGEPGMSGRWESKNPDPTAAFNELVNAWKSSVAYPNGHVTLILRTRIEGLQDQFLTINPFPAKHPSTNGQRDMARLLDAESHRQLTQQSCKAINVGLAPLHVDGGNGKTKTQFTLARQRLHGTTGLSTLQSGANALQIVDSILAPDPKWEWKPGPHADFTTDSGPLPMEFWGASNDKGIVGIFCDKKFREELILASKKNSDNLLERIKECVFNVASEMEQGKIAFIQIAPTVPGFSNLQSKFRSRETFYFTKDFKFKFSTKTVKAKTVWKYQDNPRLLQLDRHSPPAVSGSTRIEFRMMRFESTMEKWGISDRILQRPTNLSEETQKKYATGDRTKTDIEVSSEPIKIGTHLYVFQARPDGTAKLVYGHSGAEDPIKVPTGQDLVAFISPELPDWLLEHYRNDTQALCARGLIIRAADIPSKTVIILDNIYQTVLQLSWSYQETLNLLAEADCGERVQFAKTLKLLGNYRPELADKVRKQMPQVLEFDRQHESYREALEAERSLRKKALNHLRTSLSWLMFLNELRLISEQNPSEENEDRFFGIMDHTLFDDDFEFFQLDPFSSPVLKELTLKQKAVVACPYAKSIAKVVKSNKVPALLRKLLVREFFQMSEKMGSLRHHPDLSGLVKNYYTFLEKMFAESPASRKYASFADGLLAIGVERSKPDRTLFSERIGKGIGDTIGNAIGEEFNKVSLKPNPKADRLVAGTLETIEVDPDFARKFNALIGLEVGLSCFGAAVEVTNLAVELLAKERNWNSPEWAFKRSCDLAATVKELMSLHALAAKVIAADPGRSNLLDQFLGETFVKAMKRPTATVNVLANVLGTIKAGMAFAQAIESGTKTETALTGVEFGVAMFNLTVVAIEAATALELINSTGAVALFAAGPVPALIIAGLTLGVFIIRMNVATGLDAWIEDSLEVFQQEKIDWNYVKWDAETGSRQKVTEGIREAPAQNPTTRSGLNASASDHARVVRDFPSSGSQNLRELFVDRLNALAEHLFPWKWSVTNHVWIPGQVISNNPADRRPPHETARRSLECRFECGAWANPDTVVHIRPFKFQKRDPESGTSFADLSQEAVLSAPWISPYEPSAFESVSHFPMSSPATLPLEYMALSLPLETPLPQQLRYASLFQVDVFGDGSFLFPGSPRQIRGRVQDLVEQ